MNRGELAEHHLGCDAIAAALREEEELLTGIGVPGLRSKGSGILQRLGLEFWFQDTARNIRTRKAQFDCCCNRALLSLCALAATE